MTGVQTCALPIYLMIGGRDPFRLSILSLPGAEECANQFVSGAPHISNWQISAGIPEYDPLKSVHVTDDEGRSLTICYDDLDVEVLPLINGHSTIVLSLDSDFDPHWSEVAFVSGNRRECDLRCVGWLAPGIV